MIPSKHRGVFKIAAVQKGFSVKDRDHWRRVLECLSPKDQLDEIIKDKQNILLILIWFLIIINS